MEINDNSLVALGLSTMQGKVYVAALELGEATMQALARKSGVNRSTIYTFIGDLTDRGFILETPRKKRRMYSAVHPDRLVSMQKERLIDIERILPELLAINNSSSKKPRVTFYEGVQGIDDVYTDMLREKKEILAYEDLDHLHADLPNRIFEGFPKERAHRDILIRTISRDTPFAREFTKKNRGLLRETKFTSAPDFKTDINIYGDKVALMDLQGDPPFCILIESRNLAGTMRIIWKQYWEKLGPVIG